MPAAGCPGHRFAFKARQAKSTCGPACGGAVGRSAQVWARPHSRKRVLRIAFGDGLAAALDREPRRPRAPHGAVAGQAPPPRGRPDRPTTSVSAEVSVTTSQTSNQPLGSIAGAVDVDVLVCPGCGDAVVGEPPLGWPAGAGQAPGSSHPDGSVLCPDAAGRISEPVEAGGQRFVLTDAGARALEADAGAIADWAGVLS